MEATQSKGLGIKTIIDLEEEPTSKTNLKRCHRCKLYKPFTDFHKHRGRKDGHSAECKICLSKRRKKVYQKKRGEIIQRIKEKESEKEKTQDSTFRCCNKCKKEKLLTEFHKNPIKAHGHDYECKVCVNARNRKRYNTPYQEPSDLYFHKQCSKCGKLKPLTDFHTRNDRKDGRIASCKECTKKRLRNHYHKNKEKAQTQDTVLKCCNICGEEKFLTDFHSNRNACIICVNAKHRQHYQQKPGRIGKKRAPANTHEAHDLGTVPSQGTPATNVQKTNPILKCRKCGREWTQKAKHPKSCPKCKNYFGYEVLEGYHKDKEITGVKIKSIKKKQKSKIVKPKIIRPKTSNLTGLKKKIWVVGNHISGTYVFIHRKTFSQAKAFADEFKMKMKWSTDPFILDVDESPYKVLIEVVPVFQNGRRKQFKDRTVHEKMKDDDGTDTWRSYTFGYEGHSR